MPPIHVGVYMWSAIVVTHQKRKEKKNFPELKHKKKQVGRKKEKALSDSTKKKKVKRDSLSLSALYTTET